MACRAGSIVALRRSPRRLSSARSVRSRRGLGFAVLQFLTTLGGAAGPLLIGIVSDAVGDLSLAMLALLPPLFIAVFVLYRTSPHYDDDARAALTG